MKRLLPVKFSNKTEGEYTKSVDIGYIKDQIILYDSHGDVVDISFPLKKWKIKRLIGKLRKSIN